MNFPRISPGMAVWLAAIVVFASFFLIAWYTLSFHYPIPTREHFRVLDFLGLKRAGFYNFWTPSQLRGGNWYLFGLHLQVFLAQLTDWNFTAETVCMLALIAATFALWAVTVNCILRDASVEARAVLIAFSAVVFFSLNQSINLLWTWQISLYVHHFGVMLCICTLAARDFRWWHLLLAIVGMLLAVYDMSSGLVLLPVYAVLMVLHSTARRYFWLWLLVSCGVLAHNTIAYSGLVRPWKVGAWQSVAGLLQMADFALRYIGGPLAPKRIWFISLPIGGAGIVFCLFILRLAFLRRGTPLGMAILPPLGLMSVVVGGAFLVALGRAHSEHIMWVGRYSAFANFFWVGAVTTVGLLICNKKEKLPSRTFRYSVCTALCIFLLLHGIVAADWAKTAIRKGEPLYQLAHLLERKGWKIPPSAGARARPLTGTHLRLENYWWRMERERLGIFQNRQ